MCASTSCLKEKEEKVIRLLTSLALLTFLLSFLPSGLAGSDITEGGNITKLNIDFFNVSANWVGYFGDLQIIGNPATDWILISNITLGDDNVTEEDLPTRCDDLSGYLLISNESEIPDIANLVPGDLSDLDALVGVGSDSASNTFDVNTTFVIVANTITDVPTTYSYVNGASQNTSFRQGYLTDGDATIFVVIIDQATTGFDGDPHDFQFMLPRAITDYYVYALFDCKFCGDDICSSNENCRNCREDCGKCSGEEEGKQEEFEFDDKIQIPVPCEPEVNLEIETDKDTYYAYETITGTVFVNYTICRNERTVLRITIGEDIDEKRHIIDLVLPSIGLEIPFEFNVDDGGRYLITAILEGVDGARDIAQATTDVDVLGPEKETIIESEYVPRIIEKEIGIPCLILGIDCWLVIVILVFVIIFLFWELIKPNVPKKKRKPNEKTNWMWALKYSITKK